MIDEPIVRNWLCASLLFVLIVFPFAAILIPVIVKISRRMYLEATVEFFDKEINKNNDKPPQENANV